MTRNVQIDDQLLAEAMRVGEHRTKKETVTAALEEYIQKRNQSKTIKLFGTVDYDLKYDYKAQRKSR